jgi:hypothetical protein
VVKVGVESEVASVKMGSGGQRAEVAMHENRKWWLKWERNRKWQSN